MDLPATRQERRSEAGAPFFAVGEGWGTDRVHREHTVPHPSRHRTLVRPSGALRGDAKNGAPIPDSRPPNVSCVRPARHATRKALRRPRAHACGTAQRADTHTGSTIRNRGATNLSGCSVCRLGRDSCLPPSFTQDSHPVFHRIGDEREVSLANVGARKESRISAGRMQRVEGNILSTCARINVRNCLYHGDNCCTRASRFATLCPVRYLGWASSDRADRARQSTETGKTI